MSLGVSSSLKTSEFLETPFLTNPPRLWALRLALPTPGLPARGVLRRGVSRPGDLLPVGPHLHGRERLAEERNPEVC